MTCACTLPQPFASRDPASAQLQLTSLHAAWSYQLALSAIRLHHARGIAATAAALQRLQASRAAAAAATSAGGAAAALASK